MKAIEKLVRATGPRSAPRRKTKVADTPSGGASDWIRQMIIVRGRMQKK